MIYVWDMISLMFLIYIVVPWILLLLYPNKEVFWFAIGSLGVESVIKLSRILPYPLSMQHIVLRPELAKNCSCFNTGGSYKNRIGMPSGHVMMSTYILYGLYKIFRNNNWITGKNIHYYIFLCILLVFLMAISRIKRHCHNVWQVVVGCVLGIIFVEVWFYVFNVLFKKEQN